MGKPVIADEKYMALTTLRKNGEGVVTPVWVVGLADGRIGLWTSSSSGKAKRIRNNPAVTVQASDYRGRLKPGSAPLQGTAVLLASGPERDEIQAGVKAKYGIAVSMSKLMNSLGQLVKRKKQPYGDLVVVISLT